MRSKKVTPELEKQLEREREEWALRLDPGSLECIPPFGMGYYGVPEWLERGYCDDGVDYCTVVVTGGGFLPSPEDTLTDANGRIWTLAEVFTASGETECPVPESLGERVSRGQALLFPRYCLKTNNYRGFKAKCPMCEKRIGSEHGVIYVGESYEAVYSSPRPEDD